MLLSSSIQDSTKSSTLPKVSSSRETDLLLCASIWHKLNGLRYPPSKKYAKYQLASEMQGQLISMIDPTGASGSNQAEISLPQTWNYEATVAQVETIIEQIEAGELELAEVFEQFSAAVKYLRQCEDFLQERQQNMNLLIEILERESDF